MQLVGYGHRLERDCNRTAPLKFASGSLNRIGLALPVSAGHGERLVSERMPDKESVEPRVDPNRSSDVC